jgi:hypothetical protein
MSQPQLCRGAIVRAEGLVGVLWQTDPAVYVVPLKLQGAGRHRSDVRYEEPLLPSRGALRAGALMAVRSTLTVTGRVSDATISALDAALRREVRVQQFESRFPVDDAVRM